MGKLVERIKEAIRLEEKNANVIPADLATNPQLASEQYDEKEKADSVLSGVKTFFAYRNDLIPNDKWPEVLNSIGQKRAKEFVKNSVSTDAYKYGIKDFLTQKRPDLVQNLTKDQQKLLKTDPLKFVKKRKGKLSAEEWKTMEKTAILYCCASFSMNEMLKMAEKIEQIVTPEDLKKIDKYMDEHKPFLSLKEDEIYSEPYRERTETLKSMMPDQIKNNPEKLQQYMHALDFAASHLTTPNKELLSHYQSKERSLFQGISHNHSKQVITNKKDTFQQGKYNDLYTIADSKKGGSFHYIPTEKRNLYDDLRSEKFVSSPQTKDGYRRIFAKLDEMNVFELTKSGGESGNKAYSFTKLLADKQKLKDALAKNEPDDIIEASAQFEKTWKDYEELYSICKETMGFDDNIFPGNMDSVRNEDVNFEFSGDLANAARLNTIFNTYIELKKNNISLDEYLENSSKALVDGAVNEYEPHSIKAHTQGKDFKQIVDFFYSVNDFKQLNIDSMLHMPNIAVQRSLDGLAYLEKDQKLYEQNTLRSNYLKEITLHVTGNESYKLNYLTRRVSTNHDRALRSQTIGNLLICEDKDRNMDCMFAEIPETDLYGNQIGDSFNAVQYLKDHPVNYRGIMERAEIFEAGVNKYGEDLFNKDDFLESKALTYLKVLENTPKNNDPARALMEQALYAIPGQLSKEFKPEWKNALVEKIEAYKKLPVAEAEEVKAENNENKVESEVKPENEIKPENNEIKAENEVEPENNEIKGEPENNEMKGEPVKVDNNEVKPEINENINENNEVNPEFVNINQLGEQPGLEIEDINEVDDHDMQAAGADIPKDAQNNNPEVQNVNPQVQDNKPEVQNINPQVQDNKPEVQNINEVQNNNPQVQNINEVQNAKPEITVPTPGYFVKKYKEIKQNLAVATANNKVDPAENPKQFIESGTALRRATRADSFLISEFGKIGFTLEQVKHALEAALGKEETEKKIAKVTNSRFYSFFKENLQNKYSDVMNNLPEDLKTRCESPDTNVSQPALRELVDLKLIPESEWNNTIARNLLFDVNRGMDPAKREIVIGILSEQIPADKALEFEKNMEAYKDPLDIAPEDMYIHPYEEQLKALQNSEQFKNNPDKQAEYLNALQSANNLLSRVHDKIRDEYYQKETGGIQKVEASLQSKIYNENKDKFKNGKYTDILTEQTAVGGLRGTVKLVTQEHVNDYQNLLKEKVSLSDKTKQGLRLIFEKFDKMKLTELPHDKGGEDGFKVYSFSKLVAQKTELEKAIKSGDLDKIVEANKKVEETYKDHKELMELANSYFSQDEAFIPGNMDSVRNDSINFELAGDLLHTAQINTAYLIYMKCKDNNLDTEEYLKDPNGNLMKSLLESNEPYCFETVSKNLNFQDSMDLLLGINKFQGAGNKVNFSFGAGRSLAGPTVLESDASVRTDNIVLASEMINVLGAMSDLQTMKFNYLKHTSYSDAEWEQRNQTIQNLILCSDEDRNLNAMLGGLKEVDLSGKEIGESFDADKYMKEKPLNYSQIVERGNAFEQKIREFKGEYPMETSVNIGDAIYNKAVLYDRLLKNAPAEEYNDPGLQEMRQYLVHALDDLPKDMDPKFKDGLTKVVEDYKAREFPEANLSNLVTRANEAKVGVYLGSKQFDDAVIAMENLRNSMEDFQKTRGGDYQKQKDKIEIIRQRIEEADKSIDLYFDRKQKQNKMGDNVDLKTKRRIDVMKDSKQTLKDIMKAVDNLDIETERIYAGELNRTYASYDQVYIDRRIKNMTEVAELMKGIDQTAMKQSVNALKELRNIQKKPSKEPLTEEEKNKVVDSLAKLTFQEMLESSIGPTIRSGMDSSTYSYNNQIETIKKSPSFQKALPKTITRDTVRNFGSSKDYAKNLLARMKKAESKQNEIEKNNNLNKGVQRPRSKSFHLKSTTNKKLDLGNKKPEGPKHGPL